MTTIFQRNEIPIAYSMIETARRIRPRRDGRHPFEQYFLFWTAFNNIYTTIAHREGCWTQIKENKDGSIATIANGNVNIPEVEIVSEREQIRFALQEFDDNLKDTLILHEGTKYFLGRTPFFQGKKIEFDSFGQRVNGVININYTTDSQYPVWSPVDFQFYKAYLKNPENEENRNFLAGQIIDLLYTIRKNFMHGSKKFDDANDIKVVENALPMLQLIVASFTQ
ncbi:MAG: hypothetical protein ISR59_00200 [Anaerolineales bacterium]|uniref:Apea-like HEPN domain-containing protein n=1 Tax=Candidatus Desulfolinea nitratireducens TaxID=2841698 RepID=A0A8J6TF83_9CHLR|nr:hypothetical protein [Candidatus Desulfolinea nitratireducens]MBL6959499.1 hypothetical protein [Anaerolineales bacterium]